MSTKILAGRYELFDKIGEGGMSVVYKAKDRLLNRFVAIKILKPEFVSDKKFIESFRRESQSAASLSHPNIVNIFDVGQEGNIHYIVMELVEGDTLSDIIRETGPLPYQRVIELTKQIAAALSVAHANHIIHRDVKPHNVLITASGSAKITDFGIAKAMNSATIVDQTGGGVIGSVHYFSPEQARGGYVDEKSDIYSLGIVMYEMLTGRVPFDGDNPVNIALMHINSKMVLPSQLISGIPPALEQIVLRATDKIQTNRFPTAEALIEALNNLQFVGSVVGTSVFMGGNALDDIADPNKPMVATDFDDGEDDDETLKESKEKKDKKPLTKKQKVTIAAVCGGVIILGVIFGFVFGLFGGKDVVVPDFRGLTMEQAREKADTAGLEITEGQPIYDNEIEEGKIASQDPLANSSAKEGATITVALSKGAENGTVPEVIGKNEEEARRLIEDAGFKVGSVATEPGEREKGTVKSQSPDGGETAPQGSEIDIVLSDGSEAKVSVPYMIGKDVDAAKSALEEAGFKIGNIENVANNEYPENQVFWQEYKGGQKVKKGTSISLKVSNGETEEGMVNFWVDFGSARNEVFTMSVMVSDDTGRNWSVVSNEQRLKSDGGEYVQITGSGKGTVTVIFDGREVQRKKIRF